MRHFLLSRRDAAADPRRSIEERYRGEEDYLQRVRATAEELIRNRYMLQEDLDGVLARAKSHWAFAMGNAAPATGGAS